MRAPAWSTGHRRSSIPAIAGEKTLPSPTAAFVSVTRGEMATFGADVEQLEQLARTFARVGADTGSVDSQLTRMVEQVEWTGPAADRFRAEWAGHAVRLKA